MNVWKNKNFTTRNYECTNIVACMAHDAPNANFVLDEKSLLTGLTRLWIENDAIYYGYL